MIIQSVAENLSATLWLQLNTTLEVYIVKLLYSSKNIYDNYYYHILYQNISKSKIYNKNNTTKM